MLGSKRRGLRRWEKLTDMPKPGCFPHTSQTAATAFPFHHRKCSVVAAHPTSTDQPTLTTTWAAKISPAPYVALQRNGSSLPVAVPPSCALQPASMRLAEEVASGGGEKMCHGAPLYCAGDHTPNARVHAPAARLWRPCPCAGIRCVERLLRRCPWGVVSRRPFRDQRRQHYTRAQRDSGRGQCWQRREHGRR